MWAMSMHWEAHCIFVASSFSTQKGQSSGVMESLKLKHSVSPGLQIAILKD
jgi:hypothetical protein